MLRPTATRPAGSFQTETVTSLPAWLGSAIAFASPFQLGRLASLVAVVALLIKTASALSATGPSLTADQIVARYIEAIGGQERLNAIRTMRLTGKRVGTDMELPMTIEIKAPDKLRTDTMSQAVAQVQAVNGQTGWLTLPSIDRPDPIEMPKDLLELTKEQLDLPSPLVNYRDKGHQVELAGMEELDEIETYKLKVTRKSGNVEYYFLDAERFLPVKISGTRAFRGRETTFDLTPSDYREVDGILMAHRIEHTGGGKTVFDKIEINVVIPDERFAMPQSEPDAPAEEEPSDHDE